MTSKPAPKAPAFEKKADVQQTQIDSLRERQSLALAIHSLGTDNTIFIPVGIDPNVVEALDIIGDPDNTTEPKKVIPLSALPNPITATCPRWPKAQDDDNGYVVVVPPGDDPELPTEVYLESDKVILGDFVGDIEVKVDLSTLPVTEGEDRAFDLYFLQGSEISVPYVSRPYKFRVDKEKPGGSAPDFTHVYLPDEYIENGVTRAQIEADGGFEVTIIAYYGHAIDDEVSVIFKTIPAGDEYEFPLGRIPETPHQITAHVPIDFFLDNNIDGRISVAPKAWDVAGNINIGIGHELDTMIAGSPSGLQQIQVPLHDDDATNPVINLADARTPPEFVVPYFTTPEVTDQVRVTINDDTEITLPVAIGNPGDPIAIGQIPTDVIVAAGAGTNGLFSFKIDYEIVRRRFSIPSGLPKTVNCDLRASGWGTELVKGIARGPNSTNDDEILPQDSNGPLIATIPHLALDGSEAFLTNDRITVYKVEMDGTNPVVLGTPTSANQGVDLAYMFPGTALADGTNYLRYDNFRANAGGANNTESSPVWPVTVTSSSGLPGGGNPIPLTVWVFRDARQRELSTGGVQPSMNYRRAFGVPTDNGRFEGVIARIHHYTNMSRGDKIVMTVHGYANRTATGTPIFEEVLPTYTVEDRDVTGAKPTEIPEDSIKFEMPNFPQLPPPVNEEKRFVDFIIPYDPLILSLNMNGSSGLGSLRVSFTISNDRGTGVSDPASTLFLDVDARPPA